MNLDLRDVSMVVKATFQSRLLKSTPYVIGGAAAIIPAQAAYDIHRGKMPLSSLGSDLLIGGSALAGALVLRACAKGGVRSMLRMISVPTIGLGLVAGTGTGVALAADAGKKPQVTSGVTGSPDGSVSSTDQAGAQPTPGASQSVAGDQPAGTPPAPASDQPTPADTTPTAAADTPPTPASDQPTPADNAPTTATDTAPTPAADQPSPTATTPTAATDTPATPSANQQTAAPNVPAAPTTPAAPGDKKPAATSASPKAATARPNNRASAASSKPVATHTPVRKPASHHTAAQMPAVLKPFESVAKTIVDDPSHTSVEPVIADPAALISTEPSTVFGAAFNKISSLLGLSN